MSKELKSKSQKWLSRRTWRGLKKKIKPTTDRGITIIKCSIPKELLDQIREAEANGYTRAALLTLGVEKAVLAYKIRERMGKELNGFPAFLVFPYQGDPKFSTTPGKHKSFKIVLIQLVDKISANRVRVKWISPDYNKKRRVAKFTETFINNMDEELKMRFL